MCPPGWYLKSLYYALYRSFVSSLTANPFWYSQGWVILARCVFEGILTVCLRQPSCSALLPSTAPAPPNGWRNVALGTVELSPGITVWGVVMLHGKSSVFWFMCVFGNRIQCLVVNDIVVGTSAGFLWCLRCGMPTDSQFSGTRT